MILGGVSFAIPGILPEAQAEPLIGEVRFVGFNFPPRGWASCDGQLLPIASHSALFSILGTIYGGDGRTTFALPDLRGKFLMHPGNGPGLMSHPIGEKGGTESYTLTLNQLPSHTHTVLSNADTNPIRADMFAGVVYGNTADPNGHMIGQNFARTFSNQMPLIQMNADSVFIDKSTGDSGMASPDPKSNMPPYLALHCQIALTGAFPSRN